MTTETASQSHLESEFEEMFTNLSRKGGHHAIVLNAYGELESNRLTEEQLEEFTFHLAPSTKCFWIVSLVHPGASFSRKENVAELESAVESRRYFYTDREEMYGTDAWPKEPFRSR